MKFIAGALLTIMILPAFTWAGMTIIEHGIEIARLDEREKSTKAILIELKNDVKSLRDHFGVE